MEPAKLLGVLLEARGARIAVAESLTAGLLQAAVASVSGASAYFAGGLTAYTLEQKVRQLGVDREHAASVGCVSEVVAQQMAVGVAERFQVSVAAATTGFAEPWGEVVVPHAHFAVWIDGAVSTGRLDCPGLDRRGVQHAVVDAVIRTINERLREA